MKKIQTTNMILPVSRVSIYVGGNKNSQSQGPSPETCTLSLPAPAGEPGKLARYR
jgi:hypothetical protein